MKSKTFHSLQFHNFRLWFITNLAGATATWMQRVAQTWIVLTVLTDNDAFAVGVTTALQFAPPLVLGPFAGALADWANRRRIIQLTQAWVAVMGLLLGVLVLTETAELWHVYAIALITGIVDGITPSMRSTFISELVPKESLPNAVGLNSTAFNIARLIGPAVAGVLIAAVGPGWVFVINFGIFIIPITTLGIMRQADFYPIEHQPRHKGMIREGFEYVRTRSDIKAVILLITITSMFGFNMQMTQAFMATEAYGKGPGEYGLLGSAMAVGSLTGALMAARRANPRFAMVLWGIFSFGLMEGLLALSPTYWAFAVLSVPAGYAQLTILTTANALLQVTSPEHLRGRVMSLYFMFNFGATPFGAPIVGWVGEHIGPRWSLGVGAIACMGIAGVVGLWAVIAWKVRFAPTRRWPFVLIEGPRERFYHCGPSPLQVTDPQDPGYCGPSGSDD